MQRAVNFVNWLTTKACSNNRHKVIKPSQLIAVRALSWSHQRLYNLTYYNGKAGLLWTSSFYILKEGVNKPKQLTPRVIQDSSKEDGRIWSKVEYVHHPRQLVRN